MASHSIMAKNVMAKAKRKEAATSSSSAISLSPHIIWITAMERFDVGF